MSSTNQRRITVPTVAAAVLPTAVGVIVNLATEWKSNPWAWFGVGVVAFLSALVAVWLLSRQTESASGDQVRQVIERSKVGGNATQVQGGRVNVRVIGDLAPGAPLQSETNQESRPDLPESPARLREQKIRESDVRGSATQVDGVGGDVEVG